jgi:UDP-2,4-diacetamido-2,4,6-trideoxy-beta-L-altropyranose hydrolase
VDADQYIGSGHMVRCSALAMMLKESFLISFVCKSIPDTFRPNLSNHGFKVIKIDHNDDLLPILKQGDIVVLDGYNFTFEFQQLIRTAGTKLCSIDDVHDQRFCADLIINHAPGITKDNYKAEFYTQYALGIDYALLRPLFLEFARNYRRNIKQQTKEILFICFGGADPKNYTHKVLEVVTSIKNFSKIVVVTGALYQFEQSILKIIGEDTRIEHHHSIMESDMLKLMTESNLAIVPASGILFETLSSGCIIMSGYYAENQKFVYGNFVKSNAIIDAGSFSATDLNRAFNIYFEERQDFKSSIIIDGNSGLRVLKLFNLLRLATEIKLISVQSSDLAKTYEWANDSRIRKFSFNQNFITPEEHFDWFESKIADKNSIYLIVLLKDQIAGSIRFDLKESEILISYLVDPKFQGRGLGKVILSEGLQYVMKKKSGRLHFTGFVFEENHASVKAFQQLGFHQTKEKDYCKFEIVK